MPRRSSPAKVVRLPTPSPRAWQPVLGRLVGAGADGAPLVEIAGEGGPPVPARATIDLAPSDVGADLALLVSTSEPRSAVITGVVRSLAESGRALAAGAGREVRIDGERLVLSAAREIELRCGKATIVLTSDGKLRIQGTSVLAAASGLHRIRGAAVEIN